MIVMPAGIGLLRPSAGGGGGGPGAHAYWRVYVTAQNGGYTAAQEIQMFDAASPGTNQCTGGTPISDGALGGPYALAKAFDGNTGGAIDQCWVAATKAPPHWIGYHFAVPVEIATIKWWARNWGGDGGQTPKDFVIQYSDDGSAWTTSKTYSGETTWTAGAANTYSTT